MLKRTILVGNPKLGLIVLALVVALGAFGRVVLGIIRAAPVRTGGPSASTVLLAAFRRAEQGLMVGEIAFEVPVAIAGPFAD